MDLLNLLFIYNSIPKDNVYISAILLCLFILNNILQTRHFNVNKIFNRFIDFIKYETVFNYKIILQYNREYARYYPLYSEESESILWKYIYSKSIQSKIKYSLELPIDMEIIKAYKSDEYFRHYKLGIQNKGIMLYDDIYIFFNIDVENNKDNIKNNNESINNTGEIIKINMFLKSKYNKANYIQEFVSKTYIEYNNWKDDLTYKSKSIYFTSLSPNGCVSKFNKYDFNSNKTFNNIFFEKKQDIIKRLDEYNSNIYNKLGIPHTLGFLFHGEPGCGKTSCIKAIANYLDRHIVCINLSHIYDINELRTVFLSKRELRFSEDSYGAYSYNLDSNKRIYVFEEIDCTSEDNILIDRNLRLNDDAQTNDNPMNQITNVLSELKDNISGKQEKNISSNKKDRKKNITLGEILELLDGIAETDDRIIIFTTNFPDRLDKALLRPGRIDMIVEFKKLRKIDIRDNFKLWFNMEIPKEKYNKLNDYCITQAEFGKMCFENKKNPINIIDKLIEQPI